MKLLILYGTLTYNTEIVAQHLYSSLEGSTVFESIEIKNVIEVMDTHELEEYDAFLIGTSTWGDGNYPPDMEDFSLKIHTEAPNLQGKKALYFGLGETAYGEYYCGGIIKIGDELAADFGVERVGEIFKIDGYPEDQILEDAANWFNSVITSFQNGGSDSIS